jgi:hypothetical protein
MNFLVWRSVTEEGRCELKSAAMGSFVKALERGDVLPEDLSSRLKFRMDDLFPDAIELSDNQVVGDQIVISGLLKKQLQKVLPPDQTQYLKVTILNHKGRVAADDYSILHPREVCDCIDLEASQVKWNPISKDVVRGCKKLVIHEQRIPSQLQVFRLKHWPAKVLVRKTLAAQLQKAGYVGLDFVAPSSYDGMD